MRSTRTLLVVALSVGALTATATGASAYSSWGGGSYGDDLRAASYINPDTGAATANPDVNAGSSCVNPDQYDMQQFSAAGTAARNVHNDACFLDRNGNKQGKNIGASFQSRGVGVISACPDPDGAGPAISKLRDLDGDLRMDSCFQSSYQEKGTAGDFEYHARVNNNTAPAGDQDVTWGMDRDGDGRIDSYNDDSIKVTWSADGKAGSSYSYSR